MKEKKEKIIFTKVLVGLEKSSPVPWKGVGLGGENIKTNNFLDKGEHFYPYLRGE